MSWQERKKIHDQKKAAEAARQIMEQRLKELSIHPLLKENCSRDFCDAFFHGLVFAAFADNERLDKGERIVLNDIGTSLGMSKYDVDEVIDAVQAVVDDYTKLETLIDECMSAIKANESAVKLFYAQFVQVWFSSAGNRDNSPDDDLVDLAKKTGVALPVAKLYSIKNVLEGGDDLDASLLVLADWMGDDALKYFVVKRYGDVTGLLKRIRGAKASARKKECEKRRVQKVRTEFHDNCMNTGRKYGAQATVPQGWKDEFNRLFDGIDDRDINWVDECNSILVRLDKLDPLLWYEAKPKMRQVAWMILCMQFVHREEVETDAPSRWLRSISCISITGFKSKVKEFLTNYFGDVVEIP